MNYIISILLFCIVLFIYLHIYHHLKTSNDLEVYELDYPSKQTLEEVCDIRQPVMFNFENADIMQNTQLPSVVDSYGAFDIKVRNNTSNDDKSEKWLPFILRESIELCRNDSKGNYYSEHNQDFLQETGLVKKLKYNDGFLRPPMVSSCKYDYMFGSNNTKTPLRYNVNYRNYYLVTNGSITIKLFNPNSTKYLYPEKDYANFEFISSVNPWNVQSEYKNDFDKIKPLEVTLHEGDIIYIPAYWWYSIQFNEVSSIVAFKYRTYMNTIAILPHIVLYFLQQSNIKRETVKVHKEQNISDVEERSTKETEQPRQEVNDKEE